MLIKNNSLVLFQGDSITDCDRDRENPGDLGKGYPLLVASIFNALYPEKKVSFLNRGISGNRVRNLRERWEEDCLALKPDYVSILIGINDCWRRYDNNDPTSSSDFERDYRYILEKTRDELGAKIILLEPFVLPYPADRENWREDLDPKIQVVRKLAREFDALYIGLDGLFAETASKAEPAYWAGDGVHPSPAGHGLIARAWLNRLTGLDFS
ncbi:MAG TPA: SGNH/GDSL hydrolase family protein [Halanaerobiaceae bacterium]|nr:SGNH/GDSL hydrolase family protein [Bacillota bacterium]HHU93258.1 SGNH/GDSL hydrolase family protein [Halanaerobiaceae bacterium]HOA40311.1 SGNH/GDSL hydrolase family protein [Halanaerobiales bacterium]HPZ62321.1 SGNH/GDSL hydrolase family protein [Halanaerobiales bacterium]HQD03203.1 SGNH/GDSL hydrolase family protein [Halanaerobiales bacterium]